MRIMAKLRRRQRVSSVEEVPGGRSVYLTGLSRLPRPVMLDDELRGDLARSQRAPRALQAVYPWASPGGTRGVRSYPPYPLAKRAVRASEPARYDGLRFLRVAAPQSVRFCVERKKRREVLFALRRAGYSGSARKRFWRRDGNSQYGC